MEELETLEVKDALIQCSGRLEAETGENAELKCFMTANTGAPMMLGSFPLPVVIDFSGAEFLKNPTPILYDHNDAAPIGATTEQIIQADSNERAIGSRTVNTPGIYAVWKFTNEGQNAAEIRANIQNGFPYEVSVGAKPLEMVRVPEGKSYIANGREYQGPLLVATRSKIREISVVVFGACPGTSNLKARLWQKESEMEELNGTSVLENPQTEPKIEAKAPNDADQQMIQAREAEARENDRKKAIETIAKYARIEAGARITIDEAEFKTINAAKNYALRNGLDADTFDKACLEASLSRSVGPVIHTKAPAGKRSDILQCSALLELGIPAEWLSKNGYGAPVIEAAEHEQSHIGMMPIMGEVLQASDRPVNYLNPEQVVRDYYDLMIHAAGTSTTNFGDINIFSPILDKKMRYEYELQESIWKRLYTKRTVRDFKEVATVEWTISGASKTLIEDEDYPTVMISSTGEKFKTEKQGITAAITWESQVNDDMGELGRIGSKIVQLVYQQQCRDFWTNFWANLSTKYSSGNHNKITKTLTTAGLTAAKKAFRALKDENGEFVNITPQYLLVPPALEDAAWALFYWAWAGENNTKANVHKGKYQIITDAYLGADGGFTGASDTGWFMIGDPGRYPLGEYAVLQGYGTPRIVETWYDHKDGINLRAKGTVGFHGYTTKLPAVYSDGTTS